MITYTTVRCPNTGLWVSGEWDGDGYISWYPIPDDEQVWDRAQHAHKMQTWAWCHEASQVAVDPLAEESSETRLSLSDYAQALGLELRELTDLLIPGITKPASVITAAMGGG